MQLADTMSYLTIQLGMNVNSLSLKHDDGSGEFDEESPEKLRTAMAARKSTVIRSNEIRNQGMNENQKY
jgi:hypothetical protein